MIRVVRSVSLAVAAMAVASVASAAVFQYQFKTYYDGSTIASTDTKVFSSIVAGLTVSDIAGGASLSLHFKDTALPDASSSSKMQLDHLWLSGTTKGTVARQSGTGGAYGFSSSGFTLPEGQKLNNDFDFNTGFTEGTTTTLTIKGTGVTAASLLTKAPQIEIDNVGGTYGKWTNKSVRFIGTIAPIPEPSTYALMGLGLVGVAFAARRKSA
jgi:hypothetical protein